MFIKKLTFGIFICKKMFHIINDILNTEETMNISRRTFLKTAGAGAAIFFDFAALGDRQRTFAQF